MQALASVSERRSLVEAADHVSEVQDCINTIVNMTLPCILSMKVFFAIPLQRREGVKEFRRVGGPGLQTGGKPFEIIVGRVTPRGVFQFFHNFRGARVGSFARRIHRD